MAQDLPQLRYRLRARLVHPSNMKLQQIPWNPVPPLDGALTLSEQFDGPANTAAGGGEPESETWNHQSSIPHSFRFRSPRPN